MSEVILVDLPCKGSSPHCWSLNPWKARASLNYKGIPYKTEWVEYPDLAPTLSSYGVPKNDGTAAYTDYSAPAAKFPDGTWIMDSRKIAEALDKLQPEPSLHMDKGDVIDKAQAAVLATWQSLGPIGMPRVPDMLLNPRSAEYFHETRAKRLGMPLPELAKSEKAQKAWENVAPNAEKLADILKEKEGPFVLGNEVSFADFVIGGMFAFAKTLDKDGDLYGKLVGMDKVFAAHVDAVEKCFERDD